MKAKLLKANSMVLFGIFVGFSMGCQGINTNFLPKKELTSAEVLEASEIFCPQGKTLIEVSERRESGDPSEFGDIKKRESLFYFNRGSFKCALETAYEERPFMPLPPFFDFHTITEVKFNSNCLPNGFLFKVESSDHFDSVINTLELRPLFEDEETKNLKVHFRTHDDKSLASLNEKTGLKILTCE